MDQEAIDRETVLIKELEAKPTEGMTKDELFFHRQAIQDAYWRRRMAQRTDDEVKRGVCAPGR